MTARPLTVYCIDDENRLSEERYGAFFNIEHIRDFPTAQQLLIKRGREGAEFHADIFLIDVNMERNHNLHPKEVWWSKEAAAHIIPYGPLLALPFLRYSPTSVFVPYSANWSDPNVYQNGFVLTALGLILSSVTGRRYGLSEVKQEIVAEGTLGFAQYADAALERALSNMRKKISEAHADELQLVDINRIADRLTALDGDHIEWPLPVPLMDAEGELSVSLAHSGRMDSIGLSSLFADMIGFSRPSKHQQIGNIYSVLNGWRAKSIGGDSQTLFKAVITALERCGPGRNLSDVIAETPMLTAGHDRYLVKRLAMEFAWVGAWFTELDGDSSSGQTSVQAKQQARDATGRRSRLQKAARELLGLVDANNKMSKDADHLYFRWLAGGDKVRHYESNSPRRPLKLKPERKYHTYNLDEDVRGGLGPYEKALCVRYAQEELEWFADNKKPYPKWMLE